MAKEKSEAHTSFPDHQEQGKYKTLDEQTQILKKTEISQIPSIVDTPLSGVEGEGAGERDVPKNDLLLVRPGVCFQGRVLLSEQS